MTSNQDDSHFVSDQLLRLYWCRKLGSLYVTPCVSCLTVVNAWTGGPYGRPGASSRAHAACLGFDQAGFCRIVYYGIRGTGGRLGTDRGL